MGEAVVIIGVSKSFKKRKVLEEINLTIEEGEIAGILGSSGSGKSVLLKMIIGFFSPTKGTITSFGKKGFSTQSNSFYEDLTLDQNLNYFAKMYGVKQRKDRIKYLVELLHLVEYRKIKVKNLSGGTKKRVDIACALLDSPKILVLDEPFVGLDSFLVGQLSDFLKELKKEGVTIIISSHLLNQIECLCDRFFFIENTNLTEINKAKLNSLYKSSQE